MASAWSLQRTLPIVSMLLLLAASCSDVNEDMDSGSAPMSRGYVWGEGIASWYGPGFHGNQTANGEIFYMNRLTAAMTDYSIHGRRVCVTRLDHPSRQQVEVRVNDAGPFGTGAVIDLSKAAMARLEGIDTGRVRVRIRVLGAGETCGTPELSPEEIAKRCAKGFSHRIEGQGLDATLLVTAAFACPSTKVIATFKGPGLQARELVGVVKENSAAKTIHARFRLKDLRAAGYETVSLALGKNATVHFRAKESISIKAPVPQHNAPPPPPLPPLPEDDDLPQREDEPPAPTPMDPVPPDLAFPPLVPPPPV